MTVQHFTSNYTAQYFTLHCIALYTTLYSTSHYTVQYFTLHCTVIHTTLHSTLHNTVHCQIIHNITQHLAAVQVFSDHLEGEGVKPKYYSWLQVIDGGVVCEYNYYIVKICVDC